MRRIIAVLTACLISGGAIAQIVNGGGGGGGAGNPGGSAGQIQYNVGGTSFGGYTQGGDCTTDTSTGLITCLSLNSTTPGPFFAVSWPTTADGLGSNGSAFLPWTFSSNFAKSGTVWDITLPGYDLTSGTPSTIAATYAGGLVRLGAHAYTIAQAGTTGFTTNWGTCLINEAAVGGGNATITATTSVWTGAGATTVLTLEPGASACIRSDNANYTAAVSHYSQPAGANPTGTAGSAAVNGSATTFMRSDGAPAIALGSSSTFGLVKVDNTTITASGGVITATAGGSGCTISGAAGAVFNTGSSTCTTNVDITMTAGGAAPQLILGANTATLGAIKMFGNTSGDLTINPPAVAGTASKITFPAGITDFSGTGGTSQFVKQASAGAALTVAQPAFTDISGTATNAQIPAAIFATGTTVSLTAPRQYYECTAACNVTPPVPASGYEFCVRNANNTTGAITLVNPGSSVQFENQAKTAYGTATSGTLSSAGAATDQVCIVGNGTTKYDIFSITGTWTAS